MNYQHLFAMAIMGLLLSACTQFEPYRTPTLPMVSIDPKTPPSVWPPQCKVDKTAGDAAQALQSCEDGSTAHSDAVAPAIQHRFYESKDKVKGDYYLSFVEFDDQGWFANRTQMDALFALLKRLEKESVGDTLIYVYAHGWKHNASARDNNVVCFSRLLERTDIVERIKEKYVSGKQRRNVVGVYLGWRGLPFEGVLNNLSFWSRKDTAARVGRGGVFELLTRLKDYRNGRQKVATVPPGNPTQLVITGHSFGGLIIYEALSHAMMERAAKPAADASDVVESFGDFVVLVNPAFEGSLYEPLFQIATHRKERYGDKQRPVMMIVTSEADSATGVAFPVGRTISTLFQHTTSPEQAASMRQTIGHNPRYETHRLVSDGEEQKAVGDSSCKFLEATTNVDVETRLMPLFKAMFQNVLDEAMKSKSHEEPLRFNPRSYGEKVMLVPTPGGECYQAAGENFDACMKNSPGDDPDPSKCYTVKKAFQKCMEKPTELRPRYAASYPYLVVSTDVGVIADHNSIYNERFLDFELTFITEHISLAKPWTWPQAETAPTRTPTMEGLLPSGQ